MGVYLFCMAVNRAELLELFRSDPDAAITIFERQDVRIVELEAQVVELKALLGQNSRNSSRPPSGDVFFRPESRRVKGERSPGGQKGHEGRTLRMVETLDNVVVHRVATCKKCGVSLDNEPIVNVERRQVFEILVFQLIPYDRVVDLFRDVFQHPVGTGTLVRAVKSCYDELVIVEDFIRYGLLKSRVLHVDETWIRVEGKRRWLHEASTPFLTCYKHHRKQGEAWQMVRDRSEQPRH